MVQRPGEVAQVIEHLPSKGESLSSNLWREKERERGRKKE
jgi:hypothetical protein